MTEQRSPASLIEAFEEAFIRFIHATNLKNKLAYDAAKAALLKRMQE